MRIFVAASTMDTAMDFLNRLSLPDRIHLVYTNTSVQACKDVRSKEYDLILLGDRLTKGDVYDVGLAINSSKRNKGKPCVCLGPNLGRATKVANLLKPYSLVLPAENEDALHTRLKKYLLEHEEVSHP